MDGVLTRIEELFKNPDPQMRVFGLISLENHLEDLPWDGIERLLTRGLSEMDRVIVEQAKRIQGLAQTRCAGRFGPEGDTSIFREIPEAILDRFKKVKAAGLEKLQAAALDLVASLLTQVHNQVQTEGDIPLERAADALGKMRVPHSVPVLEGMLRRGPSARAAIRALAAMRLAEADGVLIRAAGDVEFAEAPAALEAVGQGDPAAALPVLRKYLAGTDMRMRRAACIALGSIRQKEALDLLAGATNDTGEEVVVAATLSMARLRDPEAVKVLVRLGASSDSARIRASVATALGRIPSKEGESLLMQYLQDVDNRTKANAIESLAYAPLPTEEASRVFIPFTRADVPRVRGNAILALFKYRPAQALEGLNPMFKSPDKVMRMAACYCASQIQNPETAHWLTTLVLTEQDLTVLKSAMAALQRFTRREAVDIFMRMTTHPRVEVRVMAMQTLGAVGGQAQLGPLMALLKKEPERRVRAAVVTAIGRVAGLTALSVLPQFLQDSDDRIVANAIEALQAVSNIEAVSYLKPLTFHRSRRVRGNAVRGLFTLGEFKGLTELGRMLESRDRRDVASALWAMGAIGTDLRLARLEENYLLVLALKDYFRKVLDSSSVPGSSLRMKFKSGGAADATVPVAPPLAPGMAVSLAPARVRRSEEEADLGELSRMTLAEPTPAGPTPVPPPAPPARRPVPPGPDITISVPPASAASAPPPGSLPPPGRFDVTEPKTPPRAPPSPAPASVAAAPEEAATTHPRSAPARPAEGVEDTALAWERVLDLLERDVLQARKEAQAGAMARPNDEVSLYLFLTARKETGDPALVSAIQELVGRDLAYFALLYFIGRELKAAGQVEESVWVYHQIFRSQLKTLDALAALGQELLRTGNAQSPPQILKLLCSISGLVPNLDLDLGNFYLAERRFDLAFTHLYRARIANPGDVQTMLKLAYLCRKERRWRLGRVLCSSIVATQPEGTGERDKALRILKDIEERTSGAT